MVRIPGPWSNAFLGRFDDAPLQDGRQGQLDANPHVPAQRLDDMPDVLEAIEKKKAEHRSTRQRQEQNKHGRLRSIGRDLLYQASLHPYWPAIRLYRLSQEPSSEIQKAVRKELEEGGYASFTDVRVGGRNLALIELEDAAWSLLGKPPIALRGRGDLPHRCYATGVALLGERRGFTAVVEWQIPGTTHAADAAWKIGEGRWEIFEVVDTYGANLCHHLEAAFLTPDSPVTRATVVVPLKKMLTGLKAQLAGNKGLEAFKERIGYLCVVDVLRELWK